ncbi:MAG: rRNA pseudouridine synthase [Nitrospinae bacterium]|nr:rRNA pseudouridine synthase [Nitrospinota bacterium]
MRMRLQKILAQSGLASRREGEAWIRAGRVSVNGEVVNALGSQADPRVDRIEVNGKSIPRFERKVYFLLNKPASYMTTCEDEHGRRTVLDLLQPMRFRIFPVGRLDWDTEGVLLLTNDGALAQQLLHPRYRIQRTYLAKVEGIPTPETLRRLIAFENGPRQRDSQGEARIARVGPRHAWIEINLREGRNRQVRRMCEAVGHPVKRLRRIQFAGLTAERLGLGHFRPLTRDEIRALKHLVEFDPATAKG